MTTYNIPAKNISTLTGKVEALNRRAARLGVTAIQCDRTGGGYCTFKRDAQGRSIEHMEFIEVEVNGGAVRLAGWRFLGTVEHLTGENVLRAVPGETIPDGYRTGTKVCDHCGLDRQRTDTFVVGHDDGSTKQLGRTCVKDYLGHIDPARLAAWLEAVWALDGDDLRWATDDDDWGHGSRVRDTFRPDDVVAASIGIIRSKGWVAKSQAEAAYKTATATYVATWLEGRGKAFQALQDDGVDVTGADYEAAAAALDWIRAAGYGNDYLNNLRVYAQQERVDARAVGILASLPAAHERALESEATRTAREAQRAEVKAAAAPAPTGKVEVTGVIVGIKEIDGYTRYSLPTTKWTLLTDAGWRLYVTAPAAIEDAGRGDTVRLTATLEPSRDDATFAFGKRPSKAVLVARAECTDKAAE